MTISRFKLAQKLFTLFQQLFLINTLAFFVCFSVPGHICHLFMKKLGMLPHIFTAILIEMRQMCQLSTAIFRAVFCQVCTCTHTGIGIHIIQRGWPSTLIYSYRRTCTYMYTCACAWVYNAGICVHAELHMQEFEAS